MGELLSELNIIMMYRFLLPFYYIGVKFVLFIKEKFVPLSPNTIYYDL